MHAGVLGSGKNWHNFGGIARLRVTSRLAGESAREFMVKTVRTRTASSPKQTSKTPGKPIKENDTVFVSSLEPQPEESTLVAHLCNSFIFSLLGKEQDRMLSNASSYFCKFILFSVILFFLFFLTALNRNTVLSLRSKVKVTCLDGCQPGSGVSPDKHPEPQCQWENDPIDY